MKIEDHYKQLKESLAVLEENIEKGLAERQRNILCYGKPQKIEAIQEVLSQFNKLKSIFKEAGLDGL